MSRKRKRHTRRLRRQFRAHLHHGSVLPRHKLIAGRTGMVHAKRLRSLSKNKRWVNQRRTEAETTADSVV